ncbi:response regulator transcription factor [Prevotella intermedia]|uniref:Helix-turn-helix transcriptional regulator n=1 Tax=Prevotella intermedia TaxID=28131 RepID=A0A2A6EE00_PREIN|nr:LuxR C-terminal-related transcriptional regulator [Prevotella intermedia]PDP59756.1 helix-turn-helix transcriptional regulator [Prevotella intermedia]
MDMRKIMSGRPRIAVIDPNTLAVLGLKSILQDVVPMIEIESFSTFEDFSAANPDSFFHFFAAQTIVLENITFFTERRQKTILLTISKDSNSQLSGFHCICVNVGEDELVRNLLMVEQHGHAGGKNFPEMPQVLKNKVLSNREIEVLSLVVQGYINKEIAIKLNISLTTVITHRKNIMEKLGMKSVSALTIYAVMHGYVDINKI